MGIPARLSRLENRATHRGNDDNERGVSPPIVIDPEAFNAAFMTVFGDWDVDALARAFGLPRAEEVADEH